MSQVLSRMADNMTFFKQIVFPPLSKPVPSPVEEEEITSFGKMLNLKYWFEYAGMNARLMVRCPICNKVYCYSTLGVGTKTYDIDIGIKDNSRFFLKEWEINCPDISIHNELNGED